MNYGAKNGDRNRLNKQKNNEKKKKELCASNLSQLNELLTIVDICVHHVCEFLGNTNKISVNSIINRSAKSVVQGNLSNFYKKTIFLPV